MCALKFWGFLPRDLWASIFSLFLAKNEVGSASFYLSFIFILLLYRSTYLSLSLFTLGAPKSSRRRSAWTLITILFGVKCVCVCLFVVCSSSPSSLHFHCLPPSHSLAINWGTKWMAKMKTTTVFSTIFYGPFAAAAAVSGSSNNYSVWVWVRRALCLFLYGVSCCLIDWPTLSFSFFFGLVWFGLPVLLSVCALRGRSIVSIFFLCFPFPFFSPFISSGGQ